MAKLNDGESKTKILGAQNHVETQEEEEVVLEAAIDTWKYVLGYVEMAAVKCAIELGISEAMENHGQPITLSELSTSLDCSPSSLHRIMRLLVHQKLFKETISPEDQTKYYSLTPITRLLKNHDHSMAALVLLESSPVMLAPWHALSGRVRDEGRAAFEATHGESLWDYNAKHPKHSKLVNDAMASNARIVLPVVLKGRAEVFEGIGTVVDVGGGNGSALQTMIKAFPWIKGINFDLPHVVAAAPEIAGVEHVGGSMLEFVPKADAAFVMNVLHDWGDEECITILRKCREAVPKDKGKVIMVEAVIKEEKHEIDDEKEEKLKGLRLMMDMVMMAHTTTGKERTQQEWEYVVTQAGFTKCIVKPIQAIPSIIIAYP
ncbi:hypothetical protein Sjap_017430 [Stephania japonica]|uniref:O-methyltransferase n=1 Tax=Stephania japonica TaxID=461633 RepID=A0AAP0I662_9MAGN|nr:COMT protein [Stephania japonica]